ncbi:MAG: VOC family protein [Proteobacteria bacterium]|nr:VOC family protein [Pseudomonadota bacterium]
MSLQAKLCRSILFVKDIQKMSAFYQKVLGLTPIGSESGDDDGWQAFEAGPAQFALHQIPEPWRHQVTLSNPPTAREGAPTKLVFHVADLAQARDELRAQGVPLVENQFLNAPGEFVRLDFLDPEGNVVQLTSVAVR